MAQQSVASVARVLALLRELRDADSGLSVHATASRLQDPARLLDDLLRGVATLARALGG